MELRDFLAMRDYLNPPRADLPKVAPKAELLPAATQSGQWSGSTALLQYLERQGSTGPLQQWEQDAIDGKNPEAMVVTPYLAQMALEKGNAQRMGYGAYIDSLLAAGTISKDRMDKGSFIGTDGYYYTPGWAGGLNADSIVPIGHGIAPVTRGKLADRGAVNEPVEILNAYTGKLEHQDKTNVPKSFAEKATIGFLGAVAGGAALTGMGVIGGGAAGGAGGTAMGAGATAGAAPSITGLAGSGMIPAGAGYGYGMTTGLAEFGGLGAGAGYGATFEGAMGALEAAGAAGTAGAAGGAGTGSVGTELPAHELTHSMGEIGELDSPVAVGGGGGGGAETGVTDLPAHEATHSPAAGGSGSIVDSLLKNPGPVSSSLLGVGEGVGRLIDSAGASLLLKALTPKPNVPTFANQQQVQALTKPLPMPDPLAQEEARRRSITAQLGGHGRRSTILTSPRSGTLGG